MTFEVWKAWDMPKEKRSCDVSWQQFTGWWICMVGPKAFITRSRWVGSIRKWLYIRLYVVTFKLMIAWIVIRLISMLFWTKLMYFLSLVQAPLLQKENDFLLFQFCFTLVVLNSCFIVLSLSIDICIEYWTACFICKWICFGKWTIMCGLLQQECKWCTVWCTQTLPRCFFHMSNIFMVHV